MSTHPLSRFVYETFGQQFGDLLMAGYGAAPGGERRRLCLIESEVGVKTDWLIELVSDHLPCRDEPLVLAALLKLLLSRSSVLNYLEFELGELLAELQWQDEVNTRQQVGAAINTYVRLLYDKQVNSRVRRRTSALAGESYYHLLTGYITEAHPGAGGALDRTFGCVYFDSTFIEGIMQGRVYFAGIYLGRLKTTE